MEAMEGMKSKGTTSMDHYKIKCIVEHVSTIVLRCS